MCHMLAWRHQRGLGAALPSWGWGDAGSQDPEPLHLLGCGVVATGAGRGWDAMEATSTFSK